ncbi:c-type cytochrome [Gracilimonas sp.]|uniref:c-type cytochrome n=1 Tax=Gracilimonas sp. TaxID=1974203 RepID=UPI002871DD62|nr:c-type cytochrome [Gracilimonas sp.]
MNKKKTYISIAGMNFKGMLKIAGIFALGITFTGCQGQLSEKPPIHPNMNMDQQPRKEAQEVNNFFADGRSMRQPVEGTVARGLAKTDRAYYEGVDENGEFITEIPVDLTKSFLYRGKERYEIYCTPCHGQTGAGNGIIMEGGYGYVPAPSYHDQRVRDLSDGELYSAIYNGVRTMPSYATQIPVEDRWAIVAYIRALQESQNISEEEIQEYDIDVAALQAEAVEEQARLDSLAAAREPQEAPEATIEQGQEAVTANACGTCHSEDGSAGIGPTWAGLFGSEGEVITAEGETITVTKDADYIRESIVEPNAKKPVDYAQGVMASYSYLSDVEIESIILYIENLDN